MDGKRQAPYTINERTLQAIEKDNESGALIEKEGPQGPRVIHKIKKSIENAKDGKEGDKGEGNGKKQADKEAPKKDGIVSYENLFKNQNGIGLFSQIPAVTTANNENAPKINFSSSNLFTGNGYTAPKPAASSLFNNTSSSSLFNNPAKTNGSSLFGGVTTGSSSLFSNPNNETKSSIFGFSAGITLPPVRSGGAEEDQQGDSAELQKMQEMKVDKTKSQGKYEYKEEVNILACGIAKKFKKNNGDLIENIEVLLQEDKKTGLVMLVARLIATKNTIFSGLIIKGKSQVRIINKKQQNLELTTLTISKEKNKPAQKDKIKLQLQTGDLGKLFFDKISESIKKQKKIDNNEKVDNNEQK